MPHLTMFQNTIGEQMHDSPQRLRKELEAAGFVFADELQFVTAAGDVASRDAGDKVPVQVTFMQRDEHGTIAVQVRGSSARHHAVVRDDSTVQWTSIRPRTIDRYAEADDEQLLVAA